MSRTTLATAALMLYLAVPPAAAAPAPALADLPLFAEPSPLNRIVFDPWTGGTWLGSNAGLILLQPGLPPRQVSFRDGLPGMKVYDIAATPDRVWVSTDGGPAVYGKGDGSVRVLLGPDREPLQATSRAIFAEEDAVWVGTNTEGLFRVDPVTLVGERVKNPVNGSDFSTPVLGIGADGPEMFISVTAYGLVQWDRATGDAALHDLHLLGDRPLYGRLLVTPERVWVGTSGDGAVYLDRPSNQMGEFASPTSINALTVGGLASLGEEIWFATHAGVSRLDGATDQWRYWQDMPWGNANDVMAVGGEVYAAMSRGFVLHYDRINDRWTDVTPWPSTAAPRHNTVNGCETVGGQVLFSMGGGKAAFYDSAFHQWKPVDAKPGLPDILVWSSTTVGSQTWFATQKGAALWDRASDEWSYQRTDGRTRNAPFGNSVRHIVPTDDGAWLATRSYLPPAIYRAGWQPGSLAHWDLGSGQVTLYRQEQGMPDDNVTRIALTPGKVWAGTVNGGLAVLDIQTKAIQPVPALLGKGTITSLLVQDEILLVGSMQGVWRVDPQTLAAALQPGTEGLHVSSLAWDAGKLWVGTIDAGVYRIDPATGARADYRASGSYEVYAYCLTILDGTLYVGTGTGVERLDLASGRWLPQMGPDVLKKPGNVVPTLRIQEPGDGAHVPVGSLLPASGFATGPAGSKVQVRLGAGPWMEAQGFSSWQVLVPLPDQPQETILNARLLMDGITRAQTAVRVLVGSGAGAPVGHVPILEAGQDDRVRFVVDVRGLSNATGAVLLFPPNATTPLTLSLQPSAPGQLVAHSPPLDPPGLWHYGIEVSWESGGATLPDAYSGYAQNYSLVVRALGSLQAFAAGVACPGALSPGASGIATMVLQNTGARPANMSVEVFGPAAAWGSVPTPREVKAAESWPVEISLQVPTGTQAGSYPLQGTVRSDGSTLDQFSCTVRVATVGGFLGVPGVTHAFLFLALVVAALLRRRA